VSNVVDATLLAADAPQANGSVLNIGCGASYSVLDLIAAVGKATSRPLEPQFAPDRPGDVKHSFANIDRARARLGYEPHVSFSEGIRETYQALANDQQGTADVGSPLMPT
jgi:nucleoside-diphosphate-sugar epimerase